MGTSSDGSTKLAQLGLARLLLKLPAVKREAVRAAVKAHPILNELLEAYEEALNALERFQRQGDRDHALIGEYEILCSEIESDLLAEVFGTSRRTGRDDR